MELDPSLIEIAGEDDSLLQQIPTLDNCYFSCSPLQIPGSNRNSDRSCVSPIMGLKDNVDVDKPTCSSPAGSSNKENINANKSEVQKLSMEPQQMKRKKRGGAYNLRKSLAWDRAFFTEEGVLNPLELSILTGSFGNSSREVLPTIHEEGRKGSSSSGSTSDSADVQGTPKMLSNQKSSRTGSKSGGCPRPLVYSSLKRPANASTTKVAMKESKLPKLPVSRPGAHSLPKSSKSNVLGTSHSKHNQFGQADIFQKSTGLQGSSMKTRSSTRIANSGSHSSNTAAKSSCQPPRRNMASVALEVCSSTDPQTTLVTKAIDVFPAAVLRSFGSRAPDSHDVSRKSEIPTTKPSGLRMPSPSLGFFRQPKSSTSNSSFGKATQPSKIAESCTPTLQRINTSNYARDPRLLHARGEMPKIENNYMACGDARVSGSSKECSVHCVGNDVSHENGKLKLEGNNGLMKENKVHNIVDDDKGFEECGEAHKNNSSCKESDFQMNDDNRLLRTGPSDQLKDTNTNDLENTNFASQRNYVVLAKGDPGMNDAIKNQHIEDKPYSLATHAVIFESQSAYGARDMKLDCIMAHNDNSSEHDVDECSRKKVERLNASFGEADQIVYGETCNLTSNDGILLEGRNSFDSHQYQSVNVANAHISLLETNGSEKLSSKSPPCKSATNESAAKVDLINASFGETDQIVYGETCNLMSNDGILLEGRNSFDSQQYQSENVANANISILETNGSEKLSPKSPPCASTTSESDAKVNPSNDKLHVEDVQVHFLDTTLLAKCCDNKLPSLEVHDQYIEFDDDSQRSGEPLKPQNCCLLTEQASVLNHGFLLDDYSLLSEGTPAEESHGVYGLGVALNDFPEKGDDFWCKHNRSNILITREPGVTEVGGFDVHEMVEQPQVKAVLSSSAGMIPSVESPKCYSDIKFGPNLSLKKRRDHLAVDVTSCDSIVCWSSSKEIDTGASGLKNKAEKAEIKFSFEHEENERTEKNGGILFWGSRSLEEFHSGDLGNSTDVSLLNQNCGGSKLERRQSASLFEYTEQANEDTAGVDKMTNELCPGDTEVQSLDGNLLVGSGNSRHSNSALDSVMVVADVNRRPNGLPELLTPSLVGPNGFQYNHGLHLNDFLLHGKSTISDEPQEEKVLSNVAFVQEQNDDNCSESKTYTVTLQVPLSIQESCVEMVGMVEHQLVEHAPSNSLDNETSTEYIKRSIDTILGNDMVFSGQSTSSESDLAVMMRDDDQTVGEITTYKAFCLSEGSGFSDQKIRALANETDVVNPGVENLNAILPDDFGVEILQTNVSPTGELQHKMDNAICLKEEEDRTVAIKKSKDGGKQNNLMIKPPINAVPFSDEWLAAMEAAGEDILTMKSGAVQNSPPARSPTEPGPWSPVKRKHNEIGPFDCTKFNIPPPDSDDQLI